MKTIRIFFQLKFSFLFTTVFHRYISENRRFDFIIKSVFFTLTSRDIAESITAIIV